MPVAKLKCTHCKEYFPREKIIRIPAGKFCSYDCAAKLGMKRQQRAREREANKVKREKKKADARFKRDFYRQDVKTRKAAAKEACHAYIRERDKFNTCICCGEPLKKDFHAGHYHESGNNPRIRYDETNIHGQNLDCNFFKGGDRGDYRQNLIDKIGVFEVAALDAKKGGTVKWTADQLWEIEQYYKQKLKDLKQQRSL